MNKQTVNERPESWSVSGDVPWGEAARSVNNEVPVVLWRAIRGGYCYDAVFSEDLRRRLSTSRSSIVRIDGKARQEGGMIEVPDLNGPTEDCETWRPTDRKRDGG